MLFKLDCTTKKARAKSDRTDGAKRAGLSGRGARFAPLTHAPAAHAKFDGACVVHSIGRLRRLSVEHVYEGLWATLHGKPLAELIEEDDAAMVFVNVCKLGSDLGFAHPHT